MSPHPTVEIYEDYYRNSNIMRIFAEEIFEKSAQARHALIYEARLRRIISVVKDTKNEGGNFLEIGAGSGAFALLAKLSGQWENVYCIEPNSDCARKCRDKSLDTIEGIIENVPTKILANAKLVCCFETIEHITNPSKMLQDIFYAIPSGSLLVLTTPNGMGFDVLELREHSTTLGWTHVNLFNPDSIKILLECTGFNVLSVTTPGILDVDLVSQGYTQKKHPTNDNGWLKYLMECGTEKAKDDFQNFLCNNNMSSHMWVVAQKP